MPAAPAATSPAHHAEPKSDAVAGCRPVRVTCDEIADYDRRYEYWDAKSEFAWEVHDASPRHEEPRTRLVELVKDIAKIRGRPITMFGNADLQEHDEGGSRLWAVQPDETIYLNRPPYIPRTILVNSDFPLPDVVFEVDLTTSIRDRKRDLYATSGIPELWVEVPDAPMPSKRKRPGLTILALQAGSYRERARSLAFPTWSAAELHAALNEPYSSKTTVAALQRVGQHMGRLVGTGPDDDPFLGEERRRSRLAGLHEGLREGLLKERLSTVEALLAARNIRGRSPSDDEADRIAAAPHGAVVQAALDSADFDDFLRRLPPA